MIISFLIKLIQIQTNYFFSLLPIDNIYNNYTNDSQDQKTNPPKRPPNLPSPPHVMLLHRIHPLHRNPLRQLLTPLPRHDNPPNARLPDLLHLRPLLTKKIPKRQLPDAGSKRSGMPKHPDPSSRFCDGQVFCPKPYGAVLCQYVSLRSA